MTTMNHLSNFVEIDSAILDELEKTADNLLEVEHLDFDNTIYLAKVLFLLKRYDESIKQFERALSLKANDKTAITFIGINHFQKNDYKTAIGFFKNALKTSPENECILSYLMISYEFLNDWQRAINYGEKILKVNPKNTDAINHLIECNFELRNFDECIFYMNQVEYKNFERKSEILFEARRFEECIETARKIKSYRLAAKAYLKMKNTVKAVKYLYKEYEKDFDIEILFEISEIYFDAEDPQRAIHYLNEALLHDSSNIKTLEMLACAHLKTGHWHDAITYAKKALKISPKVPKAYAILSEAYIQLDNMEKSREIIEKGIGENPKSPEMWIEKGGLEFTWDVPEFMKSYRKAIELNPTDHKVYIKYLRLLLMIEEFEEAKICYNQMILVNPLFEKSFEEMKKDYPFI